MPTYFSDPRLFTRRHMLRTTACGFAGVALHAMLADRARASQSPLAVRAPRIPARAKRVIFLFMQGGPSQQDLFNPQELIARNHGKKIDAPLAKERQDKTVRKMLALGPVAPVRPRGHCGMTISDLMPNLAGVADELCLMQAVQADSLVHAPAVLQFHTGAMLDARPSMGAWVSYGLGTENQNLPSFLTIHPGSDIRTYGSGFLPAVHQGTPLRVPRDASESAIPYLSDAATPPALQRRRLDFIQRMNHRLLDRYPADAQMEGSIESFEVAFRMQAEAPKALDLSGESPATLALYGVGDKSTDRNGRACLLARRFSEAGVRFVQITMSDWDHHQDIRSALPPVCRSVDRPIAGLIRDLKSRGLLDDTLVVWSGEFGRTSWSQDLSGTSPIEKHGREHQPESFCAWMAGGGVRPGLTYGKTDDFGFHPVEGKIHLHDLHATLLYLLGLDHERLTYRHAGRDFRLTDVYGRVIPQLLA
ncbi:MAG TPA: DUF1501 domain-containing protein [Tepidisphaeraceae bacterium]|nr:DUF1501 domain-containing protein [Tepidisphaeraceae bacterium]